MNIKQIKKQINKIIRRKKNIFIVSHQDIDLDGLGSILGLYEIFKAKGKTCFLVIDDKKNELGVSKVLKTIKDSYKIIRSNNIKEHLSGKDLLIIADTNKKHLLSNSNILSNFDDIIVIDHHETSNETIRKATLIIEKSVSSTCEIISELIRIYRTKVSSHLSTIILSGIALDTNNFILKTSANTHFSAHYLMKLGADPIEAQYLLKQDIKEYIERQKVVNEAKIIRKEIALSRGLINEIYRREDLAKISSFLLLFEHIELSIVIGKIGKNIIGISARSSGKYDVNKLLKNFDGGGNIYSGAAQIKNSTIEEVFKQMNKLIKDL